MNIKKYKNVFIVLLILWLIMTVVLALPFATAIQETILETGSSKATIIIEKFSENLKNPLECISKAFSSEYVGAVFSTVGKFTLVYLFAAIIIMINSKSKGKYYGIEHGSSDWCENGEQYRILDPKNGIILAEKNYLPVDKRGNTNVLVVGRFWFSENQHPMLYQMHINY